jgi:antitoxin ParD1/3/4
MSMTSLNISLPVSLKEFVETQVQEYGFSTPSEYIRNLVRDDQKRRAEEKLETLLLEGLNSGQPIEITPEYWEKKRTQLVDRHNNVRHKNARHKQKTGAR